MQAVSLPASSGWQWIREGIQIFRKQPMAIFVWAMLISLLVVFASATPPIGPLMFVLLMPAITLMTLAACKHIEAGRVMLPSMWPKALQRPGVMKKLLLLGALYAGACIAAGLIAFLPFGPSLVRAGELANAAKDLAPLMEAVRAPLILFAVFYVIIAALFWHAPVLVGWHGLKLMQALFYSGVACWRNKWAFLVYGVAWVMIFLFIDLCAGLLVAAGIPASLAGALQVPVNVAAGGILYCSFYPAYTTVFDIDDSRASLDHRDSAHA